MDLTKAVLVKIKNQEKLTEKQDPNQDFKILQ